MQTNLVVFVVAVSFYAGAVDAYPDGAPEQTCDHLTPSPTKHRATPLDPSTNPYYVDLNPFDDGNGTYFYTPGETYTLIVTGGKTFRGFFVQCRRMADDNDRVGTFAATQENTRLSSCSPATDGVTHNNTQLTNFTSRQMEWTAPAAGAGPVRFAYTVVQVEVLFWADLRTPVIRESVTESASGPGVFVSMLGLLSAVAATLLI